MPVEYRYYKIWAFPESSDINLLASCKWAWQIFDGTKLIAKSPFRYASKDKAIQWAKNHIDRLP